MSDPASERDEAEHMGKQTVSALGTLVALAVAFLGYEQTLGRLTDFEPIDAALLEPLDVSDDRPGRRTAEPEDVRSPPRARSVRWKAPNSQAARCTRCRSRSSATRRQAADWGCSSTSATTKWTKDNDPKLIEFSPITIIYITGKPTGDALCATTSTRCRPTGR